MGHEARGTAMEFGNVRERLGHHARFDIQRTVNAQAAACRKFGLPNVLDMRLGYEVVCRTDVQDLHPMIFRRLCLLPRQNIRIDAGFRKNA
jgi:hypothetical protein